MPKITNWETIEAAEELTRGEQLEPTGYKCYILRVETKTSASGNEYYSFVFDIAEGSQAGRFSEDFYIGKKWLHAFNVFVHNDNCISFAKRTLGYITESNQGFDAEAAFLADKWELFKDKKIGVVFGLEEYEDSKTGELKTSVKPRSQKAYDSITGKECPRVKLLDGTMVSAKDYADGIKEPLPPAPTSSTQEVSVTADPITVDLPF